MSYWNSTVGEEYMDIAFTVANSVVLFFTSFLGIAANVFVLWAVYHKKSLRTWNNALLVNLAVVDVLRCCLECPILLTIVLKGTGEGSVPELVCDTQVATFSLNCCLQLLTLTCISAERHETIAHPFKITQRKLRIRVWIPLTWFVGVLVASLSVAFVKDSPVYVRCRGLNVEDQLSYDTFSLYILVPLWSTCFAAIFGSYTHIFIIVRTQSRKVFDAGHFPSHAQDTVKEAQSKSKAVNKIDGIIKDCEKEEEVTMKGNGNQIDMPAKTVQHAQMAMNERKTSSKDIEGGHTMENIQMAEMNWSDNIILASKLEPVEQLMSRTNTEPESTCATISQQGTITCSSDKRQEPTYLAAIVMTKSEDLEIKSKLPQDKVNQLLVSITPQGDNLKTDVHKVLDQDQDIHSLHAIFTGNHDVEIDDITPLPPNTKENVAVILDHKIETPAGSHMPEVEGPVCQMPQFSPKHPESKLARRSGYIIVTFLIFWTPLIMSVLANFLQRKNGNSKMARFQDLEILSLSVACMTSVSNPITYAAVNPQFRTQFNYLRNKCKSLWTRA